MAARLTPQPKKWDSEAARKRAYRAAKAAAAGRVLTTPDVRERAAIVGLQRSLDAAHAQNVALASEVGRLRAELDRVELRAARMTRGQLGEELRLARGLIDLQRDAIADLRTQLAGQ